MYPPLLLQPLLICYPRKPKTVSYNSLPVASRPYFILVCCLAALSLNAECGFLAAKSLFKNNRPIISLPSLSVSFSLPNLCAHSSACSCLPRLRPTARAPSRSVMT